MTQGWSSESHLQIILIDQSDIVKVGPEIIGDNGPPPSFQKCALQLDYMDVLYFWNRHGAGGSEMMFRLYIGNVSVVGTDI